MFWYSTFSTVVMACSYFIKFSWNSKNSSRKRTTLNSCALPLLIKSRTCRRVDQSQVCQCKWNEPIMKLLHFIQCFKAMIENTKEVVKSQRTKQKRQTMVSKTLSRKCRCSGRVSSSCSTSSTRFASLVTVPVVSHEWWKDGIGITKNR